MNLLDRSPNAGIWATIIVLAGFTLGLANELETKKTSPASSAKKENSRPRETKSVDPSLSGDKRPQKRVEPGESDRREKDLLRLTNRFRSDAGLPELLWDDSLAMAAEAHAVDMASDGYFSHQSYDRRDGRLVATISASERIMSFRASGCAENIAQGQETPQQVVADWMSSDGHKANILARDHINCGTAFYRGYWVQVFGR